MRNENCRGLKLIGGLMNPSTRVMPKLIDVHQVSDGWIKKYLLTYVLPNGKEFTYESASRKGIEDYLRELERNAAVCADALNAKQADADDAEAAHAGVPSAESVLLDSINRERVRNGRPPLGTAVSDVGSEDGENSKNSDSNSDAPSPRGADAVSIVPQTADNKLVLIREFRYPLNSWCVALPAGLVEAGEPIGQAVDRELREETGFGLRVAPGADLASAIDPLPQPGYSSTGLTDETVQTVFAQVERKEGAHPEPNELIEVFLLPIAEVPRFLRENRLPMGTRLQLVLEIFARSLDVRESF